MVEIIIQVDSREQKNDEVIKHFDKVGQKYFVSKVAGADYINFKSPKVAIDLKANLVELANNLTRKHEQFKNEIAIVQNDMKCDFVVLIREPFKTFEDVKKWSSNRTKLKGEQIYKIMQTMSERYGVIWRFCTRQSAGAKIIEIIDWYDKNR